MPVIRPVEEVPPPGGQEALDAADAQAVEAVDAVGAVQAVGAVGAVERLGQDWADEWALEALHGEQDEEAARAAREADRARHERDLAHMALLIEDMLAEAGASAEDRRAIAEHLAGGRRLGVSGPCHDSWMVTTALAQAWHTYSQRARLSAGVLLSVLDGACGMVTDYLDVETAAKILRAGKEEANPEEVAEFIHWLERGDVWDDGVTDAQVRAAWARYRGQRHESAGAA